MKKRASSLHLLQGTAFIKTMDGGRVGSKQNDLEGLLHAPKNFSSSAYAAVGKANDDQRLTVYIIACAFQRHLHKKNAQSAQTNAADCAPDEPRRQRWSLS